ncbi:metallophosphoesterase [Clostridium diolis]|uniref:metallophosphoesterase n=1 Tax=Clostridium diolis TaxID=223919 RepID=UPI0015C5F53F|nr:metallophosphoesterase [Clostridium diolis]
MGDKGNIIEDDPEFRTQLDWVRNQVAKSDKKWKFVSFHNEPYSVGDNAILWEGNRMKFYRKYLIPVFDELGIDVVFVAHDHMYM